MITLRSKAKSVADPLTLPDLLPLAQILPLESEAPCILPDPLLYARILPLESEALCTLPDPLPHARILRPESEVGFGADPCNPADPLPQGRRSRMIRTPKVRPGLGPSTFRNHLQKLECAKASSKIWR